MRQVALAPAPEVHQLWSDPAPTISGTGFIPLSEVLLETTCSDGAGRRWKSRNNYHILAQRSFCTGLLPAMGDDYYGVSSEGPIYSLSCTEGPLHDFCLPESGEIRLEYSLFDGQELVWKGTCSRWSQGLKNDGSGATLWFFHNGSAGTRHACSLLRSLGFNVNDRLVSPDSLDLTNLLQEVANCSDSNVHLVASGRASEAALEIAQHCLNLRSTILFSGSGLRFSPWVLNGRELPYVVCDHSILQPRGQEPLVTRKMYAEAVVDRLNRDRGRIEVEKIPCPLYLFSGSDDQVWPSAAFSELIAQRRKAFDRETDTHHQTYPSVGHDLGPELGLPGLPTTARTISHPSTGFRLALGGKMGRQSRARRSCWERLIALVSS